MLEQSYRNAIYCVSVLHQDGGKIKGQYCGTRWCLACSRIRTARAWDRYLPVLESWGPDKWFVTITRPNVSAERLRRELVEMLVCLKGIVRAIKRTDRLPFQALRKEECTPNLVELTFHPHYHLVVRGEATARALVRRWLEVNPEASPRAQDVRQCDGGSIAELFKYFTKLFKNGRLMPIDALDTIFCAMHRRRTYQPMGFRVVADAPDEEAEVGTEGETLAPGRRSELIAWEWVQGSHDWVDKETGDMLSGYEPSESFRRVVIGIVRQTKPRTLSPGARSLWSSAPVAVGAFA